MTATMIFLSVLALIVFVIGIAFFENRISFVALLALIGSVTIANVVARDYSPEYAQVSWLQFVAAYIAIGVVVASVQTIYRIAATYLSYFFIARAMKKENKLLYLRDKGQGAVEFITRVIRHHGHGQNPLIPEFQLSGYLSRISPSRDEIRANPLLAGNANSEFKFSDFVSVLHVSSNRVLSEFSSTFACWPYVVTSSLTFTLSKKIFSTFMSFVRKVNEALLSSLFPKSPDDGEAK